MKNFKLTISLTLIITVIITTSAWSLKLNNRVKRLINATSDWGDSIKHEVLIKNVVEFCSGSIIADKFVLTAAHCVVYPNTSEIITADGITVVRAGIKNLNDYGHIVRLVEKVYVPGMFYSYHEASGYKGDIAVLKLNCGLGLGRIPNRLQALNLPMEETNKRNLNQYAYQEFVMFGFGINRIEYVENLNSNNIEKRQTYPVHLQFAYAIAQPHSCSSASNYPYYQMCTIVTPQHRFAERGACNGDSGGGLYRVSDGTLVGVISFGSRDCNGKLYPTVVTRVNSFLNFIRSAMEDRTNYWDIVHGSQPIRSATFSDYPKYNHMIQYPGNMYCSI